MSVSINAKQVRRIYKGTQKVYENNTGVWEPLQYIVSRDPQTTDTLYFMDLEDRIIFDGKYVVKLDGAVIPHVEVPISSRFKNLSILNNESAPNAAGIQTSGVDRATVYLKGNTLFISSTHNYSGDPIIYFGKVVLGYSK